MAIPELWKGEFGGWVHWCPRCMTSRTAPGYRDIVQQQQTHRAMCTGARRGAEAAS